MRNQEALLSNGTNKENEIIKVRTCLNFILCNFVAACIPMFDKKQCIYNFKENWLTKKYCPLMPNRNKKNNLTDTKEESVLKSKTVKKTKKIDSETDKKELKAKPKVKASATKKTTRKKSTVESKDKAKESKVKAKASKAFSVAKIRSSTYTAQYIAIQRSGLFDMTWYLNKYPDIAFSGFDAIEHYLKHGAIEGRNPSAKFNSLYYLSKNVEVTEHRLNPLFHYIVRGQYTDCYQNIDDEFVAQFTPEELEIMKITEDSPYFDGKWYLDTYTDIVGTKTRPIVHFTLHGAREGRNPGPMFNTLLYAIMYTDVRESGLNPLYHYIKFGSQENRFIFPADGSQLGTDWIVEQINQTEFFDTKWYLEQNPDIKESGMNPLIHWIEHGCREGRQPSADFDIVYYQALPGVALSRLNPIIHYIYAGKIQHYATMDAQEKIWRDEIACIKESEHFDTDWYLKTYTDVKSNNLDPVTHYVKYGVKEGRNPSPSFFTKFYRGQLEKSEKGINPLVHYIKFGEAKGLSISPGVLEITSALPTGNLYSDFDLTKKQPGTIAVAAHIYYDDMCEDFCKYFSHIPYKFTLLVSTDTKTKQKNIEKAFKTIANVEKLDIRLTPNRGRDLSPMLVEFYKECLAHDYVLHVHSKKSPYGSEVAGWFDYCLSHLLDSTVYTDSIFNMFRDDEKLGIVYPPAFPGVASHMTWGDMKDQAKGVLKKLKIPVKTLNKFPLDFPSGSMIWFRSKALEPLFSGKFKWDDFPEEKGQKDDTLAHIIERLFFYIADHQGYTRRSFRPALKGDYFLPRELKDGNYERKIPSFKDPLVSIIIPVYNQWEYTSNCIASIVDHTDPETTPYEIIIADDGSTDETVNVATIFSGVKVIKTPTNLGFLGNCNNAAQHAKGEYLFFLNNDTQVQPEWLNSLVSVMDKKPKAGMVGSKLIYADGSLQEAGGIIWKNGDGMNYGRNRQPESPQFCYLKEADYISGAAILVRKTLWDKLGGFDKRYTPAYYEDTDLAFETRNNGYKVYFQPASIVIHFEGKSHGTDIKTGIKKYQAINKNNFEKKWKKVLASQHTSKTLMWARERSEPGKVVAILDYYLPEYDRHAGARHTWDYIKLLVEKGYIVKYFACVVENERQLLFARELEQMGVETFYPNKIFYEKNWSDWIIDHKDYYDAVIINRPHVAHLHIDACKEAGVCILYFCHDIHTLREKRELERHGELDQINDEFKAKEAQEKSIFDNVDYAYTPSEFEEKYVKDNFGIKQVTYLPLYLLDQETKKRTARPKGKELVFVGGMRHAPNIDGILWFIEHIWPEIIKKEPDTVLNVVGTGATYDLVKHHSDSIRVLGGVSEESLNELYSNAAAVVIPLLFGAGVKGKTVEGLKLGIPTVSTSIGLEGIPEIEKVIKASDTDKDFAKEVLRIIKMKESDWIKSAHLLQNHADKYFSKKEGYKFLKKGLDMIKKKSKNKQSVS